MSSPPAKDDSLPTGQSAYHNLSSFFCHFSIPCYVAMIFKLYQFVRRYHRAFSLHQARRSQSKLFEIEKNVTAFQGVLKPGHGVNHELILSWMMVATYFTPPTLQSNCCKTCPQSLQPGLQNSMSRQNDFGVSISTKPPYSYYGPDMRYSGHECLLKTLKYLL